MADKSWPPPGPWQTIPGIARLVEKSAKTKALSPKTSRYCTDPARDDLGRFAGCNAGGGGGGGGSSEGGSESSSSDSGASPSSGVQPITADEARGDSRPVSAEEFQSLAETGQQELGSMAADASDPTGLDKNWGSIQQDAYQQVQQSWGGATYDAHTGQPFTTSDNVYAMSVKPAGVDSVSVPENATADQFNAAMDEARTSFADQLSYRGGALGVFHDDELGRIDIDPVITVNSLSQVESIGAATHAIGGAYNFADGNGYWPPHVGTPVAAARSMGDLSMNEARRIMGLPERRYLQRKKGKDKAEPGEKAVVFFDYDETITKAPGMCAHLAAALRAAGDHVVVLTGNISPRADLVKALAGFNFQFDDLVQYQDDESDGLVRAEHLKQAGATFAVDNRIDRGVTLAKVCPHLFVMAEPPKPADDDAKGTEKVAKAAAKKIGLRERPARKERRGPPRIPTNYNPNGGTPATCCGNCDMFWQGMCWGFGDVRVDAVHGKCDEWTPEEDTPGG